jgi:hypothetical protein
VCHTYSNPKKDAEKLWKPGYYGEDRTYNILETRFYLFGGVAIVGVSSCLIKTNQGEISNWLVVSTRLKNMKVSWDMLGLLFPIYGKS